MRSWLMDTYADLWILMGDINGICSLHPFSSLTRLRWLTFRTWCIHHLSLNLWLLGDLTLQWAHVAQFFVRKWWPCCNWTISNCRVRLPKGLSWFIHTSRSDRNLHHIPLVWSLHSNITFNINQTWQISNGQTTILHSQPGFIVLIFRAEVERFNIPLS